MLTHLNETETAPTRVVVMGAGGFVGRKIVEALRVHGAEVTALTSRDVDLTAPDGAEKLTAQLSPETALVVTSAKAPCKDYAMLYDNIAMMRAVCGAVKTASPAHVLYISSDAVYADSASPLHEGSPQGADNPHGIMHAAREVMLANVCGEATPLAFLRPTLIYGADDPHNGYGPNRFRRLALAGEDITLFGEGEERRDHVAVEDVADLARRIVFRRSAGALNAATGEVISFRDLAELSAEFAGGTIAVKGSPRSGPMPHNGYRPFDPAGTKAAFPDFSYTAPRDGVARAFEQVKAARGGAG